VAVGDAAFGEIVGRHFEGDAVARQDADSITAKLPGQVRENRLFLIQLHAENAVGKLLYYGSCDFNIVFFAHCPPDGII